MTTTEGNKLIAEFMQLPTTGRELYITQIGAVFLGELRYHSSWDWLMPVVENIENLGGYVGIETLQTYSYHPGIIEKELSVFNWEIKGKTGKPKIELAYQAVIEFIKWYNITKPPAAI